MSLLARVRPAIINALFLSFIESGWGVVDGFN